MRHSGQDANRIRPKGFLPLRDALELCGKHWRLGDPTLMDEKQREAVRKAAWDRLGPELLSGDLPSYYRKNGAVTLLPVTLDTSRFSAGAHCWGTELNNNSYRDGSIVFFGIEGSWAAPAFIKENDLKAFLDGKLQPTRQSSSAAHLFNQGLADQRPHPGGAPQKFDWTAIWVEICRSLYFDGAPSNQAELIRKIQNWYENEADLGPAPETSTLKPLVSKLWRALELDRGGR
jgi:hypothetical protein